MSQIVFFLFFFLSLSSCGVNCGKFSFHYWCTETLDHAHTYRFTSTLWASSVFSFFFICLQNNMFSFLCKNKNSEWYSRKREKRLSNPFIEWLHWTWQCKAGGHISVIYIEYKSNAIGIFTMGVIGRLLIVRFFFFFQKTVKNMNMKKWR